MVEKIMVEKIWHNLSFKEVAKILKTDLKGGLSEEKVKTHQKKFGKNLLPEEKPRSAVRLFLEQFRNPLIYILIIAGFITIILKEYTDSIVIFGAVILNTIVGYFQENKASKTLRELKKIIKIKAEVQREENLKIIDSSELVPGDIFILNPGDKVPADGRIIESENLRVNEMALTGEWLAAKKHVEPLPKETPLADRDNMVYMGTIIEDGKAKAVVTETGLKSEIGKIAEIVEETREEKTPLQKKLAHFSKIIGLIIALICFAIFIEGIVRGGEFKEMFIIAVAVAVAAIPEGLPVALTVILALGMQRVLKKKGLVKHLLSAEILGSTSVICTDKTCTLTEGKMKVTQILTPHQMFRIGTGQAGKELPLKHFWEFWKKGEEKEEDNKFLALKIATLCNEAFIENPDELMEKWVIRGRPTDKALLLAGIQAGIKEKELEKSMPKIAELSFNPINKYLAQLFKLRENEQILYVCGAPEKLLELSKFLKIDKKQENLTPEKLEKIKFKLENLTQRGLRVIAVAYKEISNIQYPISNLEELCNDLVFVALITLKDPIRKEVKEAIRTCQEAGMRPIIITGDHKLTARAIAEELGMEIKKENIIEGKDLDKITDIDLDNRVKKIKIYARTEPRQKIRVVKAWQNKGEVVAMVGDGINDTPALKRADIGVAIGSGTDVAKETSDLILLTDSFNIIVAAVQEGRAIIDNIRKVITYLLSDGFTEVILIGTSIAFGFPLPVTAAQILWVNLIEDGLPDIALTFEPKEKDLMKRKPESRDISLLTREMKALIFIIRLITDLILLGLFFWLWKLNHNIVYVRTIIFACVAIDSLFYVFSCKSLRRNLWHINPFSNKFLLAAVGIGILILIFGIYLPVFQTLLKTVSLAFNDWLIILGLGFLNLILIEATKYYFISRHKA